MSTENVLVCVDCGGAMEAGFLPEVTRHLEGMTCWHPGPPEYAKFLGITTGGFKVDWRKTLGVIAYRCTQCGVLKLYAAGSVEEREQE